MPRRTSGRASVRCMAHDGGLQFAVQPFHKAIDSGVMGVVALN